ncbi:MAG: methyltransferase domain-containing protein [Nanoarchaeota archaeon]|nr:methyltransferase domain-containing protein [Nanoarchaeota archaeon]
MDYAEDYYKGIAGIYFKRVLRTLIKMGGLREELGLILDFGCGVGHLKKALPGKTILGYDILPENTEVKDYRDLKPDFIVCNAVLEHLDEAQLREALDNFKKMNPRAALLVALPTENFVSKIGMVLTGYTTAHDDHKLKLKAVNKVLSEYAERKDRKMIFTMMEVAKWQLKEG